MNKNESILNFCEPQNLFSTIIQKSSREIHFLLFCWCNQDDVHLYAGQQKCHLGCSLFDRNCACWGLWPSWSRLDFGPFYTLREDVENRDALFSLTLLLTGSQTCFQINFFSCSFCVLSPWKSNLVYLMFIVSPMLTRWFLLMWKTLRHVDIFLDCYSYSMTASQYAVIWTAICSHNNVWWW